MEGSDGVLATIVLAIGFISLVVSSRKTGYIKGLGMPRGQKYIFNKSGLESYIRIMLVVSVILFIVGAVISPDMEEVLVFTLINIVFIGYALAFEKIIKVIPGRGS